MTLPAQWRSAHISEVADLKLGKMLDQVKNKGELRPYLRNVNVRWGYFDLSDLAQMRVTSEEAEQLSVCDGDLFICEGGEPGRAAVWRGGTSNLVFQKALHRLRPKRLVEADFVAAYLSFSARQGHLTEVFTGTTIRHLPQEALSRIIIPLPPTNEQRRIVAKLETLLARIAGTRKQIQHSRTLGARMRERVITSAFNGQLTSNWRRRKHSRPKETLVEISHGFTSSTKRKIAEISWRPDLQLSLDWQWASVDSVTTLCDYGTSAKSTHGEEGTPVLRMGNIQRGKIDWSSLKHLPPDVVGISNLLLQPGDVLFNRTNSFELVGKSAVFGGYHRGVTFASYLIRLRTDGIKPELLTFYLNSPFGRAWVENVASQQVGQANVNGSKLKSLGIPLPPVDEQAEIVRLIEAAFARADRLEAEAARATALLDRLEASILAKAFRGELVPQDPADEPASALLDRIRAERAAAPKVRRGRGAAGHAEAR